MTLIQQKTGIVLAEAEDSEKCYRHEIPDIDSIRTSISIMHYDAVKVNAFILNEQFNCLKIPLRPGDDDLIVIPVSMHLATT